MTALPTDRLLVERRPAGFESAGTTAGDWADAPAPSGRTEHPWDAAHRAVQDPRGFESLGGAPAYAEPDFLQTVPFPRADSGGFEAARSDPCEERGPDTFWPFATPRGWHLDDAHSQLRSARETVGDRQPRVRIAHLDTGFDPEHATRPQFLRLDLQRNVVRGERADDASDPASRFPLDQPGHGTATLALLAGNHPDVGGAPYAEVVPVRIANSVVQFHTSSVAAGIDYAARVGAHVLSMSMGGMPARAWAAAVNRAYEAGVAMFTAAGNRFGKSPPWSIVWPARFNRVVAVTGVCANDKPYYNPDPLHVHMQGCFGPPEKMPTALAAYTPNVPWALIGCPAGIGLGGGTSSATPQAAAAAALWLSANPAPPGTARWQAVEAVRYALFTSADRSFDKFEEYYGRGVLKASKALDVPFHTALPPSPADDVTFPWLRMLNPFESTTGPGGTEQMLEVEALQAYLRSPRLMELAAGADPHTDELTPAERKRLLSTMQASAGISNTLRSHIATIVPRL